MPVILPVAWRRRVISRSRRLGVGSPLGWLWTQTIAQALSRMASLKTSRAERGLAHVEDGAAVGDLAPWRRGLLAGVASADLEGRLDLRRLRRPDALEARQLGGGAGRQRPEVAILGQQAVGEADGRLVARALGKEPLAGALVGRQVGDAGRAVVEPACVPQRALLALRLLRTHDAADALGGRAVHLEDAADTLLPLPRCGGHAADEVEEVGRRRVLADESDPREQAPQRGVAGELLGIRRLRLGAAVQQLVERALRKLREPAAHRPIRLPQRRIWSALGHAALLAVS